MGSTHYYLVYFHNPLETPYTYSSPLSDLIHKRVRVTLRNKKIVGFVDACTEKPEGIEIKEILEVLDDKPIIDQEQKTLARWISKQYLSSFGEALGLFFSFSSIRKISRKKEKEGIDEDAPHLPLALSSGQARLFEKIRPHLEKFHPILVHGVTGSGKSFFYFKLAEECLRRGRQVLILVPEITLVFQVHALGTKIFPGKRMDIFHSKLMEGKRQRIRQMVGEGKIDILVATRSGFFLPFTNLGLIIIDEEHENSYKNNAAPRYQLKQVAYHWAKKKSIPLVFVSATPTVELFHQVEIGAMTSIELTERYAQASLPEIVFLSREKEEEISTAVYREVFAHLQAGKQVLFYINQRGFSSTVVCSGCRKYYQCPNCEITLTFHKKKNILTCHYCGFREMYTGSCKFCGEKHFQFIKAGTENFFDQLEKRFSSYRVVRFDSDVLSSPKQIQEILRDFRDQKIDILVGTQMLIKGHDFKNVGLVVVLAPEKYLLLPDYRSGERMFSHVMQVAGRSGRDKNTGLGRVIVETDTPHHYALQAAKQQSYQEFYRQEIENRKVFGYPPFYKLIRLVFRGLHVKEVEMAARQARENILSKFREQLVLLGPSPCLLEKQNHYYRWNILLKLKQQNYFLENIRKIELARNRKVYVEIDVSPVDLF